MKVLIAVPSCARDRSSRQVAHRRRLLPVHGGAPRLPVDVCHKYFLGVGATADPSSDEVVLPVRDDWEDLPTKMRAAFSWALDHGFDWVLKMDTDTDVRLDKLAAALPDLVTRDYTGLVGSIIREGVMGDPPGGAAYGLSARAIIQYLQGYMENGPKVAGWQRLEDFCLGKYMHQAGIQPVHEPRFWDMRMGACPDDWITLNPAPWG